MSKSPQEQPIGVPAEPYLLKNLEKGLDRVFKNTTRVEVMVNSLRKRVRAIELYFHKLQGKHPDPYSDPEHVFS